MKLNSPKRRYSSKYSFPWELIITGRYGFMLHRIKSFYVYANDSQSRNHSAWKFNRVNQQKIQRCRLSPKIRNEIARGKNVGNVEMSGTLLNFLTNLDLPRKTVMIWVTLRQLTGGHQKGGKFGEQVIKKIVLALLRRKCN